MHAGQRPHAHLFQLLDDLLHTLHVRRIAFQQQQLEILQSLNGDVATQVDRRSLVTVTGQSTGTRRFIRRRFLTLLVRQRHQLMNLLIQLLGRLRRNVLVRYHLYGGLTCRIRWTIQIRHQLPQVGNTLRRSFHDQRIFVLVNTNTKHHCRFSTTAV